MFDLFANKTELTVRQREPTTSESIGIYDVRFQFSREWDGLEKIACFKSGTQIVSVLLDDSEECVIPWEVTDPDDKGKTLFAGVYGTKGGSVVLPTVWASLGVIHPGMECGSNARPPTPSLWEQELARKQNKLTGLPGQVVGFDESGRAVPQEPPSSGTSDHRALTHREDEGAHPIEAITGLGRELSKRVEAGDALSVIVGKVVKYLADLGALAYRSSIGADDLDAAIKVSLAKADTALQSFTETDPTVPAWAKEATKPTCTAAEVEALTNAEIDAIMNA